VNRTLSGGKGYRITCPVPRMKPWISLRPFGFVISTFRDLEPRLDTCQ